ncbi:hypothetical protein OAJ77_04375 [Rhodospirillales bacterium]|nr:hypothetical protein [Rhodospirillales bacterium]
MAEKKLPKRLYKDVSVISIDEGYGIALDGNVLKTPAVTVLFTECLPLIEAVAMEWEGQKIEIDIQTLPLFRLLVASIDEVGPKREEVNRKILQFGATDLLCYRVQEPPELINRQEKTWQPIINWAKEELNVSFRVTDGISPITQSQETLCAMEDILATLTDLEMTAVSSVVTATGSLIVGLALKADVISPDTASDISILEEVYQMERWGKFKNVSDRHDQIRKETCLAYRLLRILQ